MSDHTHSLATAAEAYFKTLQARICAALEALDGGSFVVDKWDRPEHLGRGGGLSRVLTDGALFEKGGVNFSSVQGDFKPEFAASLPGDGLAFFATGISLVLHPRNPYVPTVHANFRCLQRGSALWFGGGADLTPYYPEREDVEHFHRTWKATCDTRDGETYARFKKWCDEYFYLPHRGETRGVGGIFFDYLKESPPDDFAFVQRLGDSFLSAYVPLVERRRNTVYGERERQFQLLRRGRYVEFNLLHDRGTVFGLKTDGRVESILMSLPPLARWEYNVQPEPGTREADLVNWLKPQEWI